MTASAVGSSPTTSVLGADCPANLASSFPSGREGSGSGWYPRKRAAGGGGPEALSPAGGCCGMLLAEFQKSELFRDMLPTATRPGTKRLLKVISRELWARSGLRKRKPLLPPPPGLEWCKRWESLGTRPGGRLRVTG